MYVVHSQRERPAPSARLVDNAASAGDAVARDILLAAAQQLAALAASVRHQLWQPGDAIAVAHIGGVFRSDLLRERFCMLVELEEGVRSRPPVYGPAAGALLEAYRACGLRPELKDLPSFKA